VDFLLHSTQCEVAVPAREPHGIFSGNELSATGEQNAVFTGVGLIRLKNRARIFNGLIYRRRFMQGASAREALPPA
jgi:hypothetical protein